MQGPADTFGLGLCLDDDTLLGEGPMLEPEAVQPPVTGAGGAAWFSHGLELLQSAQGAGQSQPKMWNSAVDAFSRCLGSIEAGDPIQARAYALRAHAMARLGKPDEAISSFKAALDLDPQSIEALTGLGCVLAESERPAEAMQYFKMASDARPESSPLLMTLGSMHWMMGDLDGAIKLFRECVSLNEGYYAGWVNLGGALASRREFQAAVDALEHAKAIQAEFKTCVYESGYCSGAFEEMG